MKHFIDFHEDVGIDELNYLLDIASDMKAKTKAGIEHHYLNGKTLAMIFTSHLPEPESRLKSECTSSAVIRFS